MRKGDNRSGSPLSAITPGSNLPTTLPDQPDLETWLAVASRDELVSRLRDIYGGRIKAIEAQNDFEAITCWLSGYENNSAETFRAFKLEAEKLLIWLARAKGFGYNNLPLLTRQDASEYIRFLQSPKRAAEFDSDLLKRFDRSSQPFGSTGLSLRSVIRARNILSRLFQGLREVRGPHGAYVDYNPWFNIKVKAYGQSQQQSVAKPTDATSTEIPKDIDVSERIIEHDEWQVLNAAIDRLPRETRREQATYHRWRWTLALLYYGFLRRSEAAEVRMGDFVTSGKKTWWITIRHGKGGKPRRVIAPQKLMAALKSYREFYGLPALPGKSDRIPAILPLYWRGQEDTEPMTAQVVYNIIKALCAWTVSTMNIEHSSDLGMKLSRISPHWTRHTGISHALENGADARMVQKQAGHASLNTTAIYDHKDKLRWADELEKL